MSSSFGWFHKGWQLGEAFPLKVLSCMMRDPSFLKETFDCIDPVYFIRDDYSVLASIILEYFKSSGKQPHKDDLSILIYDKCKKIDPDGSLNRSSSIMAVVYRIYDLEISDIQLIKDKVREFGRLQAVARAIQKSVSFLEDTNPNQPIDDSISKIQKILNDSFQVGTDRNSGTFFNSVALDTQQILLRDAMYGAESKVPTGIPLLDKILDGGPGAGTMNVVMAPPNRGKSTFLSYLGINASLHFANKSLVSGVKKAVIHITCEMTEPDIIAKYSSGLTGIDTDKIISSPNFRSLMEVRLSVAGPVFIKFYSPGTATVDDIGWFISNLVTVHGINPGLLILDYADKLRGMEDDRFSGMGIMYDRLIAIGHKFGIPIWTGSQINRAESQKDRHGVTGAAESWKKVEVSDNIILLNQSEEEHKSGILVIGLGKIRRGSRQAGTINCHVDFAKVQIKQVDGFIPNRTDIPQPTATSHVDVEIPSFSVPEVILNAAKQS